MFLRENRKPAQTSLQRQVRALQVLGPKHVEETTQSLRVTASQSKSSLVHESDGNVHHFRCNCLSCTGDQQGFLEEACRST